MDELFSVATWSYLIGVSIIIWLIGILSFWQVFEKAGYEGWKCVIPIYNLYILSKIGGQSAVVFILCFVPVVNIVAYFLVSNGVAKAFGKGALFAIFGLMLFSFFGYLYLGWGTAQYKKEPVASA